MLVFYLFTEILGVLQHPQHPHFRCPCLALTCVVLKAKRQNLSRKLEWILQRKIDLLLFLKGCNTEHYKDIYFQSKHWRQDTSRQLTSAVSKFFAAYQNQHSGAEALGNSGTIFEFFFCLARVRKVSLVFCLKLETIFLRLSEKKDHFFSRFYT